MFRCCRSSFSDEAVEIQGAGMNQMVEEVVCKFDDVPNNGMKEVDVGSYGKALLVKSNGKISALGTKCTHYGAPLVKGVFHNNKIRCQWHGACFNAQTGDIEDFPGLDSLPCYQVIIKDGNVKVRADKELLIANKRIKNMVRQDESNIESFVIVGGGGAALSCVETLRQEGFTGRIIMLTKEKHQPYDRPKLSKALDSKVENLVLRPLNFYAEHDIEVVKEAEVTKVNPDENVVILKSGKSVHYTKLLLATGGSPVTLNIPGNNLSGVFSLRSPEDANMIFKEAIDKAAVVIGTSFIGMEVAAYLSNKTKSLTVVGLTLPFKQSLGKEIGQRLQKLHEEKNTVFYLNTSVQEFRGQENKLTAVVLTNGTVLAADICVIGIGVSPNTAFLRDSHIDLTPKGKVITNSFLKTNLPNIFAAGDIAEFPHVLSGGARASVEHWQMALYHGKIAALNMMGKDVPVRSVPYFWCQMFGKSLRFTGLPVNVDDIIIHGNLEELQFAAYYCSNNNVIAVASMNFDPIVSQMAELLLQGKRILKTDILNDPTAWLSRL